MNRLSKNWIVEPIFDYEYKTYQALAYSTKAERSFDESKLFPYLSDLKRHIDLLRYYRSSVLGLESGIRTDLLGMDPETLELIYEKPASDEVSEFLKEILNFALDKFCPVYRRGLEEKDDLLRQIRISPVGLLKPDSWGGLIFIEKLHRTRVYRYNYRVIRRPHADEAYKDVKTRFIEELKTGMFPNYRNLKLEFLKSLDWEYELNAFLVETQTEIPTFETLIPVVKEHLIQISS
jgi:hypothetical protein